MGVAIAAYGPADNPVEIHVERWGIPYPLYDELFPEHVLSISSPA
jgi:hypothetical protein